MATDGECFEEDENDVQRVMTNESFEVYVFIGHTTFSVTVRSVSTRI